LLGSISQIGWKPSRFILVKGVGEATTKLNAFDRALQQAGVGNYNLIRLSSILPPKVTQKSPVKMPTHGDFIPIAYGATTDSSPMSKKDVRIISAAIGVGVPDDPNRAGLIMEYTYSGICRFIPGDYSLQNVEKMVHIGMQDRGFDSRFQSDYTVVSDGVTLVMDWRNCGENTYGSAFAGVVLLR
jgi:arginine decarboxylase